MCWPDLGGLFVQGLEGPQYFLSLYVLCGYVTFFLILLQYNIRPPSPNCNVCALKFAAGVVPAAPSVNH